MNYKLLPLYPKQSHIYDSVAELLFNGVKDKQVKNVGIVAHYGAGKSSLLKTFKEKYSNKETGLKFLNISLASFNTESVKQSNYNDRGQGTECSHGGVQDLDNAVEKSILQQILYKKEKNDLPQSQIKRNNNFVLSRFALYFCLIICAVFCIASFSLYALNFNNIEILRFEFWDVAYLLFGIVTFIVFVALLLRALNFSKIAFKGIELELKDQNESLLNKFLDEIIYFFQKTKYNVVIFEDLERFNNLSIFSKLRELNSILNSNEVIANSGKITFIYAVKDGMFENSKDRAKFFDLILPVFSVLSPLNVRSQIINALNESNLGKEWLTKSFIHDISFYISDMRVLNSIVNDCVALCSETDLSKLHGDSDIDKHTQIFSIMTYKNLFPQDFALFEEGAGNLKLLLDKADELRKHAININLTQINQVEEEIKVIKKRIKSNPSSADTYKSTLSQAQLKLDKLYESNKKCAGVISYIRDNSESIFNRLKENEKNKELKSEFKLLKLLINYGYIKDNFKNYIYKIGANFIAENDELYTHILLDREAPQFNLKLNDIGIILEDLSAEKFSSESALNIDMVNYLFENEKDIKPDQMVTYKQLLLQDSLIVNKFILAYLQTETDWNKTFIRFLIVGKENIVNIVLDSTLSDTKIDEFINYILTNYTIAEITNQFDLKNLVAYTLKRDTILSNIGSYANKLPLLKSYEFEIVDLSKVNFNSSDIILIEENSVWKVNYENTYYILNKLYGHSEEEISKGGITFIKSLTNKHISNYILQDLKNYITTVMLVSDSFDLNITDFKNIIINNQLSIDIRMKVIEKQISPIDYFSGCPNEITRILLEQNKVNATVAQLNSILSSNSALNDSIGEYFRLNIEKFSDKPITISTLVLCIVNFNKFVGKKTLTELYFNSIQNNLPTIKQISNDASLAYILQNKNLSLNLNDINYISNSSFSQSQIVLATKYMKYILDNKYENNLLARLALRYNEDIEIRRKIYKGNVLEILAEDDLVIVKPIVNDIINNGFEITEKVYNQINKKALDNKDRKSLLLSQVDFLTNEKLLIYVRNLGGIYFELVDKGEIDSDDDSLYMDSIILALDSKGLIKKRKKKNKYTVKISESNVSLALAS